MSTISYLEKGNIFRRLLRGAEGAALDDNFQCAKSDGFADRR